MQFNLNKLEKNLVEVEVSVSVDEIKEVMPQAYKRVANKVSLPGFRKGHVPQPVLEKQFGREVLHEDAIDILVSKAYMEAIEKFELQIINQPSLDVTEAFDESKEFKFKIKMEVLPEVKLGKYKELSIKKEKVEITDAQVEENLKSMQERYAELVLSDKKAVEKGDFAIIDFEGYLDGKAFPGGAGQGHPLEIGSGSFIPGFEEQLIGMEVGTSKDVNVTFPKEYHSEDLAGKEATFKVDLKEIKVKELPELDDEFAKSGSKFETVAEMKADMKAKMQENADREADTNFAQAAIDKAVEAAKVELPEVMVDREIHELMHRFEHNLSYQGIGLEQYLAYIKKTSEELHEDFRPEAEKRVKTDLVLAAIAKAENLEVTDEELDARIEELAGYYQQKNVAKFKKDLESKGRMIDIKDAVLLEKAADFIRANVVEK